MGFKSAPTWWPEHPDQHPEGYADQYLYVKLAEQSLGHCRLRIIVVSRIYLAAGLIVGCRSHLALAGRKAQLLLWLITQGKKGNGFSKML